MARMLNQRAPTGEPAPPITTTAAFVEACYATRHQGWHVNAQGVVRNAAGKTPLLAVAEAVAGVDTHRCGQASAAMGLGNDESRAILRACDAGRGHDAELRAGILGALGVVDARPAPKPAPEPAESPSRIGLDVDYAGPPGEAQLTIGCGPIAFSLPLGAQDFASLATVCQEAALRLRTAAL